MEAGRGMTLVVGGSGKTGSRVAKRLTELGLPVRTSSRSSSPPFDWSKPSTWQEAVRGIESVYLTYYPDLAVPNAPENIRAFCKVAVESGVRRIVLLSGRGEPHVYPCELAVRESGADFTIVRCSWFNQNFSEGHMLGTVLEGVIAMPGKDYGEPFIDADDIADVVVAALTREGHSGKIYELTGPRLLTWGEIAAELTRALGRPILHRSVDAKTFQDALSTQMPSEDAAFFTEFFTFLSDGHNAHVTNTVEQILGRKPRDFRDYVHDAAKSGVWNI